MSLDRPTPEQILAAAERELTLVLKRLIACRNRLYRETGTYPDDLGRGDLPAGLSAAPHPGRAGEPGGSEGRSGEAGPGNTSVGARNTIEIHKTIACARSDKRSFSS